MSAGCARVGAVASGVALAAALALACDGGAGADADASADASKSASADASKSAGAGAGTGAGAASAAARAAECATCHMPEYRHASDPVHVDVNPTTCGVCHTEESWRPSALHHPFWALTGAHEKAKCFFCHQGTPPRFEGTPKACVTCHLPEYESSTYPGHATFPTTCADCHTTTSFKPATKKPPPPAPPPVTVTPPLGSAGAGTKLPKLGGARVPKAPPLPALPQTTPPRAPTSRPPDVITRPSPRR